MTMRILWCLLALVATYFVEPAVAQEHTPKALRQILHCVETDKFGLLSAGAKKNGMLQVAWAHQVRTEPYVDEFFIVLFESSRKGDILVYSRVYAGGKVEFYLGNNATLVIHAGKLELIDPLYGLWTRDNITRNVKKALRSRTYQIPVRTIMGSFANVACHSYDE